MGTAELGDEHTSVPFSRSRKMRRRRENAPLCAPFLLPKGRESLLPHLSHAKGKALFPRCSGNFLFHKPYSWLLGLRDFTCSGGVRCGENPAAPIWGDCPALFSPKGGEICGWGTGGVFFCMDGKGELCQALGKGNRRGIFLFLCGG